jgi:peptide/nickel transport system permease protein
MAELAPSAPLAEPSAARGRRRRLLLGAALRDPKIVLGGGFIVLLVLLAAGARFIAPHDPLAQDLMLGTLPPIGFDGYEPGYFAGTDDLGRDVLSRFIYGSQIALTVAFASACLAAFFGTLVGLLAGFYGGAVDAVVSRLIEIWMAFPAILLSILIVAIMGPGVHSVIFAIAVIDWTRFARVVRVETMTQKSADYVTAARVLGFGRPAILFGEILPNVLWAVLGLFTLEMGIAVVVEAILSFVGLSVSSDTPTWGGMIAQGRGIIYQAWWVFALPLAGLFATVLAFNQLGDGLRRALDPVMQR